LKRVDGRSIAAYDLLWGNGLDFEGSNVDEEHTIRADPLLDKHFKLGSGSPCIDTGAAQFIWRSTVVLQPDPGTYSGLAPDLGAFEFE